MLNPQPHLKAALRNLVDLEVRLWMNKFKVYSSVTISGKNYLQLFAVYAEVESSYPYNSPGAVTS